MYTMKPCFVCFKCQLPYLEASTKVTVFPCATVSISLSLESSTLVAEASSSSVFTTELLRTSHILGGEGGRVKGEREDGGG